MTCENSIDEDCGSCMASLIRSQRRTRQGSGCSDNRCLDVVGDDGQQGSAAFEASGGPRIVVLAVMAFVVPVIVSVVVVQLIESRVGSAAAAIAGLAAAGLTALASALIVKGLACRSAASGADR